MCLCVVDTVSCAAALYCRHSTMPAHTLEEEPPPAAAAAPAILSKLAALDVARKAAAERRREETREAADPHESTPAFLQAFTTHLQSLRAELQALLAAGPCDPSTELAGEGRQRLQDSLDRLASSIFQHEKQVSDASYFLPAFDQKQCMLSLVDVKAQLEAGRATLLPKKKFAFSRKVTRVKGAEVSSAAATSAPANQAYGADSTAGSAAGPGMPALAHEQQQQQQGAECGATDRPTPSQRDIQLVQSGCGLMGLRGQVVVRQGAELDGQDFVLVDLEDCTVYLLGHMPALRMIDLRNTRVFSGPVTGACFVDHAVRCTLVLATYQARIHHAKQTDFYLRVRSNPIIEHSSEVSARGGTWEGGAAERAGERGNWRGGQGGQEGGACHWPSGAPQVHEKKQTLCWKVQAKCQSPMYAHMDPLTHGALMAGLTHGADSA